MNFQVPQFIEVEDKIFGPFTFKQFIYLAGGAGATFVVYTLFPLWVGVWIMIPIILLSLALAFYKINNRSFVHILEAAFRYLINAKLYLWQKKDGPATVTTIKVGGEQAVAIPKLSESKLHDLSWSLDVKENIR